MDVIYQLIHERAFDVRWLMAKEAVVSKAFKRSKTKHPIYHYKIALTEAKKKNLLLLINIKINLLVKERFVHCSCYFFLEMFHVYYFKTRGC